MSLSLRAAEERWPIAEPFVIARGAKSEVVAVVVEIADGAQVGRGEGIPYPRHGESAASVLADIAAVADDVRRGAGREDLLTRMAAGAARNAIDCALWDLWCQHEGVPVWQLAKLAPPRALITAYTLTMGSAEASEERAREQRARPLLKVKLGTDDDAARLRAVRRGAPDAAIVVDANEGWNAARYRELLPLLSEVGVTMIEQPLAAADDAALIDAPRPIALCADESFLSIDALPALAGRYDALNLKLDKLGGLTAALMAREAIEREGMKLMVGCHMCTSLSLAPAMLVAADAALVDLDAGLLLSRDRDGGVRYRGSEMQPLPALWGVPRAATS